MGNFYFSNLSNVTIDGVEYKNIYTRIHIKDLYRTNENLYDIHKLKDGDDIQSLAYQLYGDRAYYWIIILSNGKTDWLYDFPLSDIELRDKVAKYMLTAPTGTVEDTVYEAWREENETKRVIYALKPSLLPALLEKIKDIYKGSG